MYLWGPPSPLEADSDSSEALGSRVPRLPLGPLARLLMLLGEAPLHRCLQELRAEQALALSPLLLWAWGWGPSACPGAWASWLGASGHSQSQSPHSDQKGRGWPSWHASCCSGNPEKVRPATQRGRLPWRVPLRVWPGRPLFACQCLPLCLSAALSAKARAGQRPWSPGEWSCCRLPAPDVAPRGPRKIRGHIGAVQEPRSLGFASTTRAVSACNRADSSRMRPGCQPWLTLAGPVAWR